VVATPKESSVSRSSQFKLKFRYGRTVGIMSASDGIVVLLLPQLHALSSVVRWIRVQALKAVIKI
jgi:hypothetical protein